MTKLLSTFLFSIITFFAQAQSASYSIECPKPDSCFLKETSIGLATAQDPRPQTVVSYRLFRSPAELDGIVAAIRKQAADQLAKGTELINQANTMNGVADKIKAAWPK